MRCKEVEKSVDARVLFFLTFFVHSDVHTLPISPLASFFFFRLLVFFYQTNIQMVQGMGNFFLALTALWACIICCVRKKIALAIGITKEAARALAAMSSLILFPVIQTAGLLVFSVVWFVYMFYLASSGEIVVEEYEYYGTTMKTQSYVYSENQQKAYWYLIFCWFWTSEFIMAVGQLVTAMSVAFWYFARDKSTINSATVFTAISTTLDRKSVV